MNYLGERFIHPGTAEKARMMDAQTSYRAVHENTQSEAELFSESDSPKCKDGPKFRDNSKTWVSSKFTLTCFVLFFRPISVLAVFIVLDFIPQSQWAYYTKLLIHYMYLCLFV